MSTGEEDVFRCERCGSSYSAMHAVALQNCPRCQIRDKVAAPLAFTVFTLPEEYGAERGEQGGEEEPGVREPPTSLPELLGPQHQQAEVDRTFHARKHRVASG
jgi:hypothetical protein